jgi:hypothetical protein
MRTEVENNFRASGEHHQMGLQKSVKEQASSRKGVVDHDYTKNITTCLPPTQLDSSFRAKQRNKAMIMLPKKSLRQGA